MNARGRVVDMVPCFYISNYTMNTNVLDRFKGVSEIGHRMCGKHL